MKSYDHNQIDAKWQARWAADKRYHVTDDTAKEKCYVLDMFPYPSGAGLHVGHPKGYIATDVYSRYKTMQGFNVLHPMGWDAFGLPAENFAIKNKVHPKQAVDTNVARFKEQLEKIGFTYDWEREINTTDPAYYKWTQWAFVQMFKRGLAYESYEPINWCPSCKTGLANEDLDQGRCERCDSVVEKKPMRQWVLKITDYADRLLEDLDDLPWSESVKLAQRNWIGKSEGALLKFKVQTSKCKTTNQNAKVLLLHGTGGTGSDNWFPWLRRELEDRGYEVIAPDLPNAELPLLEDWLSAMERYEDVDIVVGHSLGSTLALQYAARRRKPLKKLILTASPHENMDWGAIESFEYFAGDVGRALKSFVSAPIDFEAVATNCESIIHFVSDNDPYIPLPTHELFPKQFNTVVLGGRGHFNEDADCIELPEVLEAITSTSYSARPRQEDSGGLPATSSVDVFTTRPDTLYGATYVVLAPEHDLVAELLEQGTIENADEVRAYIEEAKQQTEIDRTDADKEKTGVKLEGVLAVNPANQEEVPIFIADYVLAGYGTGAIMAVPAHDERDFAFAKKYGLPIRPVIGPHTELVHAAGSLLRTKSGTYLFEQRTHDAPRAAGKLSLFGGGIEEVDKSMLGCLARELAEELELDVTKYDVDYLGTVQSKNDPNRVNTIFLIDHINPDVLTAHECEAVIELTLDEILQKDTCAPVVTRAVALLRAGISEPYTRPGILANSGPFTGMDSEEAKAKITEHAGGKLTTQYRLQDWVFSRQRYWGEPIPIIHCEACGAVPVPEEQLPVTLPDVESYEPTGTGESPLANITEWVNTTCPTCGGPAKRETNTMPQWAGSSWYYLRYMNPKNENTLVAKDKEQYWAPVDVYVGGMEHATRHLIYARFWHKFLYDIGVVSTKEPFMQLYTVGLIMAEDGRKMSKRWGNVINPDDVVAQLGADTLRVYEMFMGPFGQAIAWSTDHMVGARRFLEKVYGLRETMDDREGKTEEETVLLLNQTIKKVGADIETFNFNTAISQMMILVNHLEKLETVPREAYETLVRLLAPFAPHLTEELWELLGNTESVHSAPWPEHDETVLAAAEVTIAVQVNGKVRDTFTTSPDSPKEELITTAKALEKIEPWLAGKEITKEIVVPNRLVNFVVS